MKKPALCDKTQNRKAEEFETNKELRQKELLSSTLLKLVLQKIKKKTLRTGEKIIAYAGDTPFNTKNRE